MRLLDDSVWVCTECYMDHHEGRAMKDSSVDWSDNNMDADDNPLTRDFSTTTCGSCGTDVAGARHRMATWEA